MAAPALSNLFGVRENKMETTGIIRIIEGSYIGIMEN